jgi:hypothetical protein
MEYDENYAVDHLALYLLKPHRRCERLKKKSIFLLMLSHLKFSKMLLF